VRSGVITGSGDGSRKYTAALGASGSGSTLQKQSDPEGGIPSGSLEVTWEVEVVVGQKLDWSALLIIGVAAKFFRVMS
jgi:hypothetical protein